MVKSKSVLLASFGLASVIFSSPGVAEFDNSIGFGVQYAGVFGWQGSWTENNVHTRIAFGLLGAIAGIDVDIDERITMGGSYGAIGIAEVAAFNVNYYPGGRYTEGWRVGVDVGTAEVSVFGEDSESFACISFGYSFK